MVSVTPRAWAQALGGLLLAGFLVGPTLSPTVLAAPLARSMAGATVHVTIQNFAFSPAKLTVAPGTTVIWTQKDSVAHTVTSDDNAWGSDPLDQGKTFSMTFTKAGTYKYHCSPHPYMTGTIIVGAVSGMAGDKMGGDKGMNAMGPMSMASMKVFTGWYDDKKVQYLSTDTSSKDEATRDHINYAPGLAKLAANAGEIYLVTNGAFANRGPVFNSVPGDATYTPLWQEVQVTWKDASAAKALGKDEEIEALAKAGKLTLKKTGIVLNCPILTGMMMSNHM